MKLGTKRAEELVEETGEIFKRLDAIWQELYGHEPWMAGLARTALGGVESLRCELIRRLTEVQK